MSEGLVEPNLDPFAEEQISRLMNAMDNSDPVWTVMETDLVLENSLREAITAKKVMKRLEKGNYNVKPREIEDRLKNRPLWMLLIDSHLYNIIDRKQFRKIATLRKKSGEVIKNFTSVEAAEELQKNFYKEWHTLLNHILKENKKLRNQWKRKAIHVNGKT